MVSFHLPPNQRTRLQALLPRCQDVPLFRRIQALLWLDDGESAPSVARRQGVTEQSVHNWIHRFQEAGEPSLPQRLSDRPRSGRKPRLKSQVEPLVDEILGTSPQNLGYAQTSWTAALVRLHLQEHRGINVSEATVWRAIRHTGYSWKRPRYSLNRRPKTWRQKKGV